MNNSEDEQEDHETEALLGGALDGMYIFWDVRKRPRYNDLVCACTRCCPRLTCSCTVLHVRRAGNDGRRIPFIPDWRTRILLRKVLPFQSQPTGAWPTSQKRRIGSIDFPPTCQETSTSHMSRNCFKHVLISDLSSPRWSSAIVPKSPHRSETAHPRTF